MTIGVCVPGVTVYYSHVEHGVLPELVLGALVSGGISVTTALFKEPSWGLRGLWGSSAHSGRTPSQDHQRGRMREEQQTSLALIRPILPRY